MNKLFLLAILSLSLVACDRGDKPKDTAPRELNSDNTDLNVRDRNSTTVTPFDQSARIKNSASRDFNSDTDLNIRDRNSIDQNSRLNNSAPRGFNSDNTDLNIRDRDSMTDQNAKLNNSASRGYNSDNTGLNVRDRNSMTVTPGDQSESTADRTITQQIRQAIMSDSSLSMNAKNIKIMTIQGVVTLRGPVATTAERESIAAKVSSIDGIQKVDNQLEVISNNINR